LPRGGVLVIVLALTISISSIAFLLLSRPDIITQDNQIRPNSINESFQQKTVKTTQDGIVITLEGLMTRYGADDAIWFTVTAKGHGKLCSSLISRIVNVDSGDEVEHFSKNFPDCNFAERDVDEKWTLDDILKAATGSPHFPVVVGSLHGSGQYKLLVEYGGATLEQDFIQD
jgi:hypothetical protein